MRRLLVSLLAMAAVLFALDRAIGAGMERLFRTSTSVEDGDVLRRAWNARAPIVICGSSRAMHHYAVDSLGDELGIPAWNLGRDGAFGSLYPFGCAGVLLRHYTPRVWILEVERSVVRGPELLARLSCFLPYADDEPVAREVVGLRSREEPLRLLSRTYRYNSLVLSLLSPRLGKSVRPRRGFLPLEGAYHPPARPAPEPRLPESVVWPPVDSLKLRYLRRTIDLLHGRGVVVLATDGPRFARSTDDSLGAVREAHELGRLFAGMNVPFLDLSSERLPQFRDPRLYKDESHLNEAGALQLTRVLADSLRARGFAAARPAQ